jgi:hypothetical protein
VRQSGTKETTKIAGMISTAVLPARAVTTARMIAKAKVQEKRQLNIQQGNQGT